MAGRGRIGTDESGKGDYFGPLVVGGVYVRDGADEDFLRGLEVRDSKRISDRRVAFMAGEIAKRLPHSRVAIGPARYNELYDSLGNLNRILAWAHARAIENLAGEWPEISRAVTDKFGDDAYVARALMKRGRELELVQKVRAEEDVAVAAASIVARAGFLAGLERLSKKAGLPLPKGASASVEEAARRLVQKKGRDALREFAKVHFKTTSRLCLEGD
ncbi:MAG TPA: ribonuclease HIII [bacterium]|nr:ribonuclease HIII [bacterium]